MADELAGTWLPVDYNPFTRTLADTLAAGATAVSGNDPVVQQLSNNATLQRTRFGDPYYGTGPSSPEPTAPPPAAPAEPIATPPAAPAQPSAIGPETPLAAYEYEPALRNPRPRARPLPSTHA